MTLKTFVLTAALVALPAAGLAAQSTYAQRHHINNRRADEQARIKQGEASGQLTHHEAAKLEKNQHAIHREEKADRAADGGHLTAGDRRTIAAQQNRQSRAIYNQKHDAQTQPGVTPAPR